MLSDWLKFKIKSFRKLYMWWNCYFILKCSLFDTQFFFFFMQNARWQPPQHFTQNHVGKLFFKYSSLNHLKANLTVMHLWSSCTNCVFFCVRHKSKMTAAIWYMFITMSENVIFIYYYIWTCDIYFVCYLWKCDLFLLLCLKI